MARSGRDRESWEERRAAWEAGRSAKARKRDEARQHARPGPGILLGIAALVGVAAVLQRQRLEQLARSALQTLHRLEPFLIAAAVLIVLGLVGLAVLWMRRTWRKVRRRGEREVGSVVPDRHQADVYPLGKTVEQPRRLVAFRPKRYELSTVVALGQSGSGKSTVLARSALHAVRHGGHALCFVDPHRRAVLDVWARLTPEEKARTLYLDPGQGRIPFAINMLDVAGVPVEALPHRALLLRDLVASLGHTQANHRQVREAIHHTVAALLQLNSKLPAESQLSIFAATRWWTDEQWRTSLLPYLDNRERGHWSQKLTSQQKTASGPLLDLVDILAASPGMPELLGQPQSTWSAGESMDRGKILLVGCGSDISDSLLANLLAVSYLGAALARQTRPQGEHWTECSFVIDEAPLLDGALGGPLRAGMMQSRKFGLSWWLGSQFLDGALSENTIKALFANRSVLLCAALGYDDARIIAKNAGDLVDAAAIVTLPKHRFICQVGRETAPFLIDSVVLDAEYRADVATEPEQITTPRPDLEAREDQVLGFLSGGGPAPLAAPSEAVPARYCAYRGCDKPLDPRARPDREFCSDAHRKAEARAREKEQRQRPYVVPDEDREATEGGN